MAKYYVDAGDLKVIIDRPNAKRAAIDAFKTLTHNPVETLNGVTVVSEEGFEVVNDNDWGFSTMELLEQSNQLGTYKSNLE